MFSERDALIRLLQDDDQVTVNLVKEQLLIGGADNLPGLRDLLKSDDEKMSLLVSDIIRGIESEKASVDFAAFCRNFGEEDDIEKAAWLLAAAILPGFDPQPYRVKLDNWGRQLTTLKEGAISDRERVEVMARFMSDKLTFRGNTDDYYNLRNSLLPTVIDTRCGIPISLSLLYVLVARRANIAIDGINLPGHFIARHGEIFFDPFHLGKILTLHDCREILARQNVTLEPEHLMKASQRGWLIRILANLLFISERAGDTDQRERVMHWLAALDRRPGAPFSGDNDDMKTE